MAGPTPVSSAQPLALLLLVRAALASRAGVDCDEVTEPARREELLSPAQRADVDARLTRVDSTFRSLESFLIFVGYSRSGHTLLGALLDGHPQVIVSNELHALAKAQTDSKQLLSTIALNSATCAVYGRTQAGFNYSLNGALPWQGRWCQEGLPAAAPAWCAHGPPRVIGDKRGGGTSLLLERLSPADGVAHLLKFSGGLRLPLRVLHVMRSPYDMAATQFFTHSSVGDWHKLASAAAAAEAGNATWRPLRECEQAHLNSTAGFYARLLTRNAALRAQLRPDHCACALVAADDGGGKGGGKGGDSAGLSSGLDCVRRCNGASKTAAPSLRWLDLKTESLVRQPVAHLRAICAFLGVACPEAYVSAAAGAVRPSRHETSALLRWPEAVITSTQHSLEHAAATEAEWRPLLDGYARRPPSNLAQTPHRPPASRLAMTRTLETCRREQVLHQAMDAVRSKPESRP